MVRFKIPSRVKNTSAYVSKWIKNVAEKHDARGSGRSLEWQEKGWYTHEGGGYDNAEADEYDEGYLEQQWQGYDEGYFEQQE